MKIKANGVAMQIVKECTWNRRVVRLSTNSIHYKLACRLFDDAVATAVVI
jgi:hypothetical protein